MQEVTGFSLESYEAACYARDHEQGMRQLLALLRELDGNYGNVSEKFSAKVLLSAQNEEPLHIWTRIASATSCLMADPALQVAPEWQTAFLSLHRWFSAIFASSPFRNADHIMRALNQNEDKGNLDQLNLRSEDLYKFAILYSPESEVNLDLNAMWQFNPILTASLAMVLVSPRFLASAAAHGKREVILPWLSERLDQIPDIEDLPVGILHDLYMHCSYADRRDKHDIKKPINALIRRKLAENGLFDLEGAAQLGTAAPKVNESKPTLFVVLEWFTSSHSIYRTHSRTMEAARERFHVVGLGYADCVDDVTREVFDEFVPLSRDLSMIDQLRLIRSECESRQAAICYMPSVGMFPLTMWLSNLRVAPKMMMALGHPATTHSQVMDYVVVEEDYVGDPACFSEKLMQLPWDGMPYRPSASAEGIKVTKPMDLQPDVVRIAVCSTTMKLNPGFLEACAQIANQAKVKVHFHFLLGQNQGLVVPQVRHVIKQYLGDTVTIYPHQNYIGYMDVIAGCDMFINPFPFGNTNGIIDTVSAGLVGVCKSGPEVHEHIDEGLFGRLQLPNWLVADTVTDYVSAAVRLAENHAERCALRQQFAGPEAVDIFFKGRPSIMGEMMLDLI